MAMRLGSASNCGWLPRSAPRLRRVVAFSTLLHPRALLRQFDAFSIYEPEKAPEKPNASQAPNINLVEKTQKSKVFTIARKPCAL